MSKLHGCCENHSNIYTANEEGSTSLLKSQSSSSLSITARRLFSFWTILGWNLEIVCRLVLLFVFSVHKEFQWTRSGQAPSQVGFNSFVCHTVTLQLVVKNVQISSHLICVWTFFFFEKSSMASRLASRLSPMPDLQNNKIRFVNIGLPRSYCKLYKKSIF